MNKHVQYFAAIGVALLLAAYTWYSRKVDGQSVTLAVVIVAILVIDRVRGIEFAGFKLELDKVKDSANTSALHAQRVEDALTEAFVSAADLTILESLAAEGPYNICIPQDDDDIDEIKDTYRGLRARGMIKTVQGRHISGIVRNRSPESSVDIKNYVTITDLGRRFMKHKRDILAR